MTRRPEGRPSNPVEQVNREARASVHSSPSITATRSAEWREPKRGGRAVGGRVIGRYRARSAFGCGCCGCPIRPGEHVYEVLTADDVADVCADCAGTSW